MFEAGLGNAHEVVAGRDLLAAVVGHVDDRAAGRIFAFAGLLHERQRSTGHRDQRVGRGVDRVLVHVPRGLVEHVRAEVVLVGERDRVDDEVQRLVILLPLIENGLDRFVIVRITGHQPGLFDAELLDGFLDALLHLAHRQEGEADLGALLDERLRDEVGVAAFVGDAEDDAFFAGHQTHGVSSMVAGMRLIEADSLAWLSIDRDGHDIVRPDGGDIEALALSHKAELFVEALSRNACVAPQTPATLLSDAIDTCPHQSAAEPHALQLRLDRHATQPPVALTRPQWMRVAIEGCDADDTLHFINRSEVE